MRSPHAITAVLLIAVCTSGCFTASVYDDSWAPLAKTQAGACPEIEGVFENAGEYFSEGKGGKLDREELSLAHILNGGWSLPTHHVADGFGTTFYKAADDEFREISLRLEGDRLLVEAMRPGGELRKFAMPVRHGCHDSLQVLATDWGMDLFSASFMRGHYAIGRAEDGALLVYRRAYGEALGVFWAVKGEWIRFAEVKPEISTALAAPLTADPVTAETTIANR